MVRVSALVAPPLLSSQSLLPWREEHGDRKRLTQLAAHAVTAKGGGSGSGARSSPSTCATHPRAHHYPFSLVPASAAPHATTKNAALQNPTPCGNCMAYSFSKSSQVGRSVITSHISSRLSQSIQHSLNSKSLTQQPLFTGATLRPHMSATTHQATHNNHTWHGHTSFI